MAVEEETVAAVHFIDGVSVFVLHKEAPEATGRTEGTDLKKLDRKLFCSPHSQRQIRLGSPE